MLEFFANISMSEIKLVRFIESRLHCGLMQRQLGSDEMVWSRGMYALLDLDPETDRPSFSLLQRLQHPEDRRTIEQANANIEAAKPFGRTYRVIRRDGTMRVLSQHVEVLFDSSGKPDRSMILVWDVTEQTDLKERAIALEKRFEGITRDSGLILNLLRPDGFVSGIVSGSTEHDAELNRRYGYLWHDLIHPEDKAETLAAFARAVDEKCMVAREHRILQRDGSYRWRRSTWSPVFDNDRNLKEFISISQDIENEKSLGISDYVHRPITGSQVRGGRALVNWSVQQLSNAAGVSPSVVRRIEDFDGVTESAATALDSLRLALAGAGVEFIFLPIGKPGVRPL